MAPRNRTGQMIKWWTYGERVCCALSENYFTTPVFQLIWHLPPLMFTQPQLLLQSITPPPTHTHFCVFLAQVLHEFTTGSQIASDFKFLQDQGIFLLALSLLNNLSSLIYQHVLVSDKSRATTKHLLYIVVCLNILFTKAEYGSRWSIVELLCVLQQLQSLLLFHSIDL